MPEERAPYARLGQPTPAAFAWGRGIDNTHALYFASTNCTSSVKRNVSIWTASVGQRAAHKPQRIQRLGSKSMALAVAAGDSADFCATSAATLSSPLIESAGTSLRQSVGQTSTQPLHRMHFSPSKTGLMLQIRQRPPCSLAVASLNPTSTFATPM